MTPDQPHLIAPPENVSDYGPWRKELAQWRSDKLNELRYDGSGYRRREFEWVSSCYSCNMLMVWDEQFLDHRTGRYRVEEYLHEGETQFGGYDAVVLWHAYPRIGFDARNLFDFYRDLPGGLPGLRDAVRRFHAHGVKVFIDYNPWDTGTRREPVSDNEALGEMVHGMDVDGIFLDTLDKGSLDLRHTIDKARPGVAFESEDALPLESLPYNHLSWAQWFGYGVAPGLLRNRWIEQRHTMHVIRRWDTDHTDELHLAWMNGAGMLVWENVFGSWVGWSPANRSMLKRMLFVQRRFRRFFSDGIWTPLVTTHHPLVYASEWALDGDRVWTIVNRSSETVKGPLLDLPLSPDHVLMDAIRMEPLQSGDFELGPREIASFCSVRRGSPLLHARPRDTGSASAAANRQLNPTMVSAHRHTAGHGLAADMMEVSAGDHSIVTHYRVRECGERGYARMLDSTYPSLHTDVGEPRSFHLDGFALARREVSNREFAEFLHASGYKPHIPDKFLHHWVDGKPPAGAEDEAVVYVDLADARAYTRWRGVRLPSDAEWQVAMEMHHPPRRSKPVWNFTDDEYADGRTRFVFLKGGSWYQAEGSEWYADGGDRPANFAAKFIEVWPGVDRCGTIGFRIAVDL